MDYRQKLEVQSGALLAGELKNNAFKVARWAIRDVLSGVENVRIVFASRTNLRDPSSHAILGVMSFKTGSFAQQVSPSLLESSWGVLKFLLCEFDKDKYADGKYVLMKDPNKVIPPAAAMSHCTSHLCASTKFLPI